VSNDFRGVLPALVTPFNNDHSVDESTLRGLIRHALTPSDAIGVVVNAVAAEADSLSRTERERVISLAREAVPEHFHVVTGIAAATAEDARSQTDAAAALGAHSILLQAPASFARGIADAPEIAVRYIREVARSGVPIVLFQHQANTLRSYPVSLLLRLLEIENVVAVKETIWDVARYEQNVAAVRRERPDVQVLLANDTLLLPCMISEMPDGLLLGFASLAGKQIAQLWRAVKSGQLDEARRLHAALAPLRDAIYANPALAYYPRMKAALHLLGILPNMTVRSPLIEASAEDIEIVRAALVSSGLL
jgi:4-hydroxy-tetrahydrodipicolinate synthase